MQKHILLVVILLPFILTGLSYSSPQQNDALEIAFLDIVMTPHSISVVNMTIRPGVLREYHWFKKEGILYVVFSADGDTLWKGMLDDPLIRRFEYLDNEEKLRMMSEQVERAEFTIRIPYSENTDHIRFYEVRFPLDQHPKSPLRRTLIKNINLKQL
jgi:hypothetical protein